MASEKCPHCGGYSWYESDGPDLWHRCLCGFRKIVATTKDGYKIIHTQQESMVQLPRRGSKLSICLGVVASMWPVELTTKQVSERTDSNSSDTASHLMVLAHKGLVVKTKEGRGLPGGSTWKLTNRAVKKLNL